MTDPEPSTAEERRQLRQQMASYMVHRNEVGRGPRWWRRWATRNAHRHWYGALERANEKDRD